MKRREMLEYIEGELEDFVINYQNASIKAKKHKIRSAADGILTMIEGFGMKPPPVTLKDPGHFPGDSFEYTICDWEEE